MPINENSLSSYVNYLIRKEFVLEFYSDIYQPTRRAEGTVGDDFGVDARIRLNLPYLHEMIIQYKVSKRCLHPKLQLPAPINTNRKNYFVNNIYEPNNRMRNRHQFTLLNHSVMEIEFKANTNDLYQLLALNQFNNRGVPAFILTNPFENARLLDRYATHAFDFLWILSSDIYYPALRFFLHHPGSTKYLTNQQLKVVKRRNEKELKALFKKGRVKLNDPSEVEDLILDRLKVIAVITKRKKYFIQRVHKELNNKLHYRKLKKLLNILNSINIKDGNDDENLEILKSLYIQVMQFICSVNNLHYISKWSD